MKQAAIFFILFFFIMTTHAQKLDVQGHRGCRGLLPENTIPAFVKALNLGVFTIEMDVVISKDGQVVVSHEPFLNPNICLDPNGNAIENQFQFNLYQMTYEEIKSCDCGSIGNVEFPDQAAQKSSKPLLSDVIKAVEWHIKSYTQYEVDYNIEIKSTLGGDRKNHPSPEEFSDLVYNLIDLYLPMERIVIQSFDFRVLKYWHSKYPKVRLAVLVDNKKSVNTNLANLGFIPTVYSCNHVLLAKENVEFLQKKDIKVIPWTVNDTTRMKEIVSWGVDGFITDYPNRAEELGFIKTRKEDK